MTWMFDFACAEGLASRDTQYSIGKVKNISNRFGFNAIWQKVACSLLMVLAVVTFSNAEPFMGKLKLLIIRGVYTDTIGETASDMLAKYPDEVFSTVVNETNDYFLKSSWGKVGIDSIGKGSALVAGCAVVDTSDKTWYADLQIVGEQMAQAQGYNPQTFDIVMVVWNCVGSAGAQTHAHNRIYYRNDWNTVVLSHELRHALLMKAGQPSWEACAWWIASGNSDPLDPTGVYAGNWDVPDIGGSLTVPQSKLDLNACTKFELGWLTPGDVFTVPGYQDYCHIVTLYPVDSTQNSNYKSSFAVARNCLDPSNPNLQQVMWGEFRTRYTGIPSIEKGILIHLAPCDRNPISTTLLDMSMRVKNAPDPRVADWWTQVAYLCSPDGQDIGLPVGRTFNDFPAKIHITPWSVDTAQKNLTLIITTGDFADDNSPNGHITFSGNIINDTNFGETYPNRAITLNAHGTDPDRDPLAYFWNFGDGTYSTDNSVIVNHAWPAVGTYSVSCEISDTKGMVALAMGTVYVYQTPPQAPTVVFCSYLDPLSSSKVNVFWNDNDPSVVGYKVVRMDKDNNIIIGIDIPYGSVQTCVDRELVANTQYNYKVQAYTADNRYSEFSNIAEIMTPAIGPDAPDNLTATVVSSSQINYTWRDNDNLSNETGYILKVATGSGGFQDIAAGSPGLTIYSLSTLTPNTTYHFIVCATNAYGMSCSNVASATTFQTVPAAPTNLSAAAVSETQIYLTWTDNSDNESSFFVEQALSADGPFTEIVGIGSNGTYYPNTGLNPNMTYWYRVRASNDAGQSAYSNVASATTLLSISAPSNLSSSVGSSTQINVSWTDNSTNEAGFSIERAASNGGPWTQIGSTGANVTNYSNTGLSPNSVYWYRVRAYNGNSTSNYSNVVSATTQDAAPIAPSNLTATAASSSQINLTWSDNSNNETGFYLEESTTGTGGWNQIAILSTNTSYYSVNGLSSATAYWFRIRAYGNAGISGYSNAASATTFTAPPAAPVNCAASGTSISQITVVWNDMSSNETGFSIERATAAAGPFSQIGTVNANQTNFNNTGLSGSTTYWYRVASYNAYGQSAYSNVASATTQAGAPNAPTSLGAVANSRSQITLSWTDNAGNETGFYIERAASGGSFSQIASVGANVVTYVNTGLSAGTAYQYRVRAYNNGGMSAYSNTAAATTHGNLAVNGTASASTQQTGNEAAKAKDNNTGTRWCASSSSMPQWWKVDLGSSKTVSAFEMMFEKTGTSGDCYDFKIEVSTNNTTWTTAVDRSTNTNTAQTQAYSWTGTARYVRITINDAPGNYWASIYECGVYGN